MNRVTKPGVVLALLAVLTACGVRPTGVVQAGEAPAGVGTGPVLYFLTPEGRTIAAPRVTGRLGTVEGALNLLFAGPDQQERARGLTTGVPYVTPAFEALDASVMVVRLPVDKLFLGQPAVDQIACTAIVARIMAGAGTGVRVSVFGADGLAAEHVGCSQVSGQ